MILKNSSKSFFSTYLSSLVTFGNVIWFMAWFRTLSSSPITLWSQSAIPLIWTLHIVDNAGKFALLVTTGTLTGWTFSIRSESASLDLWFVVTQFVTISWVTTIFLAFLIVISTITFFAFFNDLVTAKCSAWFLKAIALPPLGYSI